MSPLADLIVEVGSAIERRPEPARARTLSRLTDQFCRDAEFLGERTVEVYDGVMQRFAVAVDVPARAELSGRIAPVPNGPRGVLRVLALDDEIAVAGPVLAQSPRLDDQDLVAVAATKGVGHRLAICARACVSEPVTDVLVTQGERPVRTAIALNGGASFSATGTATLLDAARDDEILQDALGRRRDLPEPATRQLVSIAEQSVRRRLVDTLPTFTATKTQRPFRP